MLGLLCIRLEFLNGARKHCSFCLSIFVLLGGKLRKNIPAFVCYLASALILVSCFLEPALAIPRKEMPELPSSGQKLVTVDVGDPGGREAGVVLKVQQNIGERGTKSSASGDSASVSITPKREAMGGERSKENPNESYQCDGYCGLYLTLPLWIVTYWLGFKLPKPNVELTGAEPTGEASSDQGERG